MTKFHLKKFRKTYTIKMLLISYICLKCTYYLIDNVVKLLTLHVVFFVYMKGCVLLFSYLLDGFDDFLLIQ